MSLKELYGIKHPTAWVKFEKGDISEDVLVSKFFRDGRTFDSEGMKSMMVSSYPLCGCRFKIWHCCQPMMRRTKLLLSPLVIFHMSGADVACFLGLSNVPAFVQALADM